MPAMQAPRCVSDTEVMLSRASPAPTQARSHIGLVSCLLIPAIDRPAQRHQPLHQVLRVDRFGFAHLSFPRWLNGPQSGHALPIPVVQR
ncbi:hypothetical protein FIV38_06455 [Pseudomonas proteolytica]|nr:hypothetical protein F4W61_04460 [Pseudomonas proteolytica]TWR84693.1 hypothetical protein FIV38_06455 [Pseudomonas proteolytica]